MEKKTCLTNAKNLHSGGGINHRLKLLLFSFTFIVCGWLISSREVHADNATISGQYLYVSSSICPSISEGQRLCYYYLGGADAHDYYWYTATYIYVSSPEVVGNQIRYKITGAWHEDGDDNPREYHSGPCAPPTSGTMNVPYYSQGHSFSNYSSATCTAAATQRCSRCRTIKAYGNALGHIPGAAATCTTPQKCTRCGATLKNALGHNWQTATLSSNNGLRSAATCTAPATYYKKCSRCTVAANSAQYNNVGAALGHVWDDGTPTPDATPYNNGKMIYICQRDGTHRREEVIPQKHFQIYNNGSRINKIYLGNTLIMNSSAGANVLVK